MGANMARILAEGAAPAQRGRRLPVFRFERAAPGVDFRQHGRDVDFLRAARGAASAPDAVRRAGAGGDPALVAEEELPGVSFGLVGVPCFDIGLTFDVGWCYNAIIDGSCSAQAKEGETRTQLFELRLNLLLADTFLGELSFVF